MKRLVGSTTKKARGLLKDGYSRFLLRVGFILLMLGLIAFSIYQLVSHMTVGLDTLRTQEITEEAYVNLELFVFRDEEVLPSKGELYQYHVYDGERVGVGDKIATVYTSDGEIKTLQSLLRLYAQRIGVLKRCASSSTPENLQSVKEELDRAYIALLTAAEQGKMDHASDAASKVKTGLVEYSALVAQAQQSPENITALTNAMASLTADYPVSGEMTAIKSGYYDYDTDGYELLFDVDQVMTMSPDAFLALTTAAPQKYENGGAGKMIYSATWYAAAYVSLSDVAATAFEVGDSYEMICSDSMKTRLNMKVVRMEATKDGALVVFQSQQMPEGFSFQRRMSVQTLTDSNSGYRIPTEALVTLTSEQGKETVGVYILEGNVVEFRKVHISVARDGYTVVSTYEEVKAMLEALPEDEKEKQLADGWSYLNLNDKIITRGTGLYEGKMIS